MSKERDLKWAKEAGVEILSVHAMPSKEIIEKMGGSLEIQSEPGKGTTAYIIIPCEMSSIEKKTEITA